MKLYGKFHFLSSSKSQISIDTLTNLLRLQKLKKPKREIQNKLLLTKSHQWHVRCYRFLSTEIPITTLGIFQVFFVSFHFKYCYLLSSVCMCVNKCNKLEKTMRKRLFGVLFTCVWMKFVTKWFISYRNSMKI